MDGKDKIKVFCMRGMIVRDETLPIILPRGLYKSGYKLAREPSDILHHLYIPMYLNIYVDSFMRG